MRPWQHALSSSRGTDRHWTRDLDIHEFLDSTKGACADRRHRFTLHSVDLGAEIAARAFPDRIEARAVVSQHVEEDLGFACKLSDWLVHCDLSRWPRPFSRRAEASREAIIAMVKARHKGSCEEHIGKVHDLLLLPLGFSGLHVGVAHGVLMNSFGLTLTRRICGPPAEIGYGVIVDYAALAESIIFAMYGRIPHFSEVTMSILQEPTRTNV